jgi:ketosteroid isomerase-like protein
MRRFVCAVLLALATQVPVAASAGAPEDVAAALDRWAATFNANDIDALAKLYTPNAVLVGTTGSTLIEGK